MMKVFALVASVLMLTGCASQAATTGPVTAVAMQNLLTQPVHYRATQAATNTAMPGHVTIYIEQGELPADQQAQLVKQAQYLLNNPQVTLYLVGHAAVSNSASYNLAQGYVYAEQIKKSLLQQGVNPVQIHVVSYGSAQPEFLRDHRAGQRDRVQLIDGETNEQPS